MTDLEEAAKEASSALDAMIDDQIEHVIDLFFIITREGDDENYGEGTAKERTAVMEVLSAFTLRVQRDTLMLASISRKT